jgi:hypothetical protein
MEELRLKMEEQAREEERKREQQRIEEEKRLVEEQLRLEREKAKARVFICIFSQKKLLRRRRN